MDEQEDKNKWGCYFMHHSPSFIGYTDPFIQYGGDNKKDDEKKENKSREFRPVFLLQREKHKMVSTQYQQGMDEHSRKDDSSINTVGLI